MIWKLWLDDQLDDPETPDRHTPEGFIGAKGSYEALELIKERGMPAFIDFDFYFGGTDTATSFLYSLKYEHPKGPIPEYKVHSRNPEAKKMISNLIKDWKNGI